jgi:hypothetical protein
VADVDHLSDEYDDLCRVVTTLDKVGCDTPLQRLCLTYIYNLAVAIQKLIDPRQVRELRNLLPDMLANSLVHKTKISKKSESVEISKKK